MSQVGMDQGYSRLLSLAAKLQQQLQKEAKGLEALPALADKEPDQLSDELAADLAQEEEAEAEEVESLSTHVENERQAEVEKLKDAAETPAALGKDAVERPIATPVRASPKLCVNEVAGKIQALKEAKKIEGISTVSSAAAHSSSAATDEGPETVINSTTHKKEYMRLVSRSVLTHIMEVHVYKCCHVS